MPRTTRLRGRIESNIAKNPLPPEVLALIAEELQDDRKALQALSRVSSAWCQRARDLRFRTVFLGDPKAKTRCKALVKLFTNRPSLAHATHTLTIVDNRKTAKGQSWLDNCPDLEKFLACLISVKTVVLRGGPGALMWGKISTGSQAALLNLFGQTHVKEVGLFAIQGINITPFVQFSNLNSLALHHVLGSFLESAAVDNGRWVAPSSTPSHRIDTVGGLKTLQIGGCGKALKTLFQSLDIIEKMPTKPSFATLDLSNLKEIRIQTRSLDRDAIQSWQTVLERYSSQVERYHIEHDHMFWLFSEMQEDVDMAKALLSLKCFPKLSSLSLNLMCEDLTDWGQDEFSEPFQAAVLEGFKELPANAPVKELNITVLCEDEFGDLPIYEDLQEIIDHDRFLPQLADLLVNETTFPHLAKVSLLFELRGNLDSMPVREWPLLERDFGEKLKRLGPAGRDVLEINYVWKTKF